MPQVLPEALLEGLAWDADGRVFEDLSGVLSYSARVASAVGAMMCVLMGVRDPHALARACDLGAAMQLTNIARDVGEDARAGRLYLPIDWFAEMGADPGRFLKAPQPTSEVRAMVKRLLREADHLYRRSQAGIAALPRGARAGIWAARLIYDGIGGAVRRNGYDSVTLRGRTSKTAKFGWIGQAGLAAGASLVMPRSAVIYAPPLPETAFLVDAAGRSDRVMGPWGEGRGGELVAVFAALKAREGSGGVGIQA